VAYENPYIVRFYYAWYESERLHLVVGSKSKFSKFEDGILPRESEQFNEEGADYIYRIFDPNHPQGHLFWTKVPA
jgi:hypothetical protein